MLKIDKESRIKLQTNIDLMLHHRFKAACVLRGKNMNEVLTDLISSWLKANKLNDNAQA
ncbi:TPA: hypothetical protein R1888_004841 [Klebsiella oxytoca]|nr:hypothetical protein [Klebsiella oxytoca]